jgi:phytoene dehydrogenase-like protein
VIGWLFPTGLRRAFRYGKRGISGPVRSGTFPAWVGPYTQAVGTEEVVNPKTPVEAKPSAESVLDAVVVGAGLAGLACARDLAAAGLQVRLLEAADAPGGRVRTDVVEGFRLDRGFQVLLTEYPEARRVLNYDALALKSFLPGALVRQAGSFHRFADPFRELQKAVSFAFDPIVPLGDKWRVAKLRGECVQATDEQIFAMPEETTREWLRRRGFSPAILERFFEPFFGGIFLERNLSTSARWFRWLFRMFATGLAAVPELGMERIPAQMAEALPADVLKLGSTVHGIEKTSDGWRVDAGQSGSFLARQVVMAATEPEAKGILAKLRKPGAAPARVWNRTTTIYYSAPKSPIDEPVIVLNGDGPTAGPVNHMAVMSLVSPAYAPAGAHLICANVVGAAPETDAAMETLEAEVRMQMRRWFGAEVNAWGALGGYPIACALPMQGSFQPQRVAPTDNGIVLCGDYVASASIQGALVSGANAAVVVGAALAG